jgi:hypothetical protein
VNHSWPQSCSEPRQARAAFKDRFLVLNDRRTDQVSVGSDCRGSEQLPHFR